MSDYYFAWWNLENLFDLESSPTRPAWLKQALRNELRGWTSAVLNRKLDQLVKVIRWLNDGRGPDLLGVCEVENQRVMERLVERLRPLNRRYAVAHHDTSDQRGIDVGFIYDRDLFTAEEQFFHVVLKRSATRDLFQVNFRTADGKPLIVIGNHWPSRSGGQFETEPYRILAAETLSYWMQRILEIRGPEVPVLVMGDLNDQPFDRSVTGYALSVNNKTKALNAEAPRLFNLMCGFFGQGIGTYYHQNFPNLLDQILVSRGILNGQGGFRLMTDERDEPKVKIERFPDMVATGDYPRPIPHGRPAEELNPNGFSDHFPISVQLAGT